MGVLIAFVHSLGLDLSIFVKLFDFYLVIQSLLVRIFLIVSSVASHVIELTQSFSPDIRLCVVGVVYRWLPPCY